MDNKNIEQYTKTLTMIKNYISSDSDRELGEIFSGDDLKMIKEAFGIMENQMNLLCKDENPYISSEDKDRIKKAVSLFLYATTSKPIIKILESFAPLYLELAFNWNINLGKCQDIELMIKAANRILSSKSLIDNAARTVRVFIEEEQFRKYEPPAFKIKEYYLKQIREKWGD